MRSNCPKLTVSVFIALKVNPFRLYISLLQLLLVPCGSRKRVSVLHHSVVYISMPLVINEPISGIMKNFYEGH